MNLPTVTLDRDTIEAVEVKWRSNVDASDDAVYFALTTADGRPTEWVQGAWHPTDQGWAVSPTIGASTADLPATPGRWRLWSKVTDDPEVPVHRCCTIVIT